MPGPSMPVPSDPSLPANVTGEVRTLIHVHYSGKQGEGSWPYMNLKAQIWLESNGGWLCRGIQLHSFAQAAQQ
jgi:hypothetical protein